MILVKIRGRATDVLLAVLSDAWLEKVPRGFLFFFFFFPFPFLPSRSVTVRQALPSLGTFIFVGGPK
jgi:hypothetical protein